MRDLLDGFVTVIRAPRAGLRLPVVRQFVKFGLVGILNTVTSYVVYLLATRRFGFEPVWANPVAFVAAVSVSYLLNKFWTFRDPGRPSFPQYARFVGVSAGGLAISETCVIIFHRIFGWNDLIAFSLGVIGGMFWNFGANRAWTFSRR